MLQAMKMSTADIQKENKNKKKKIIESDIRNIKEILNKSIDAKNEDAMELHKHIDGKYSAHIKGWGIGMDGYIPEVGFDYSLIDDKSLTGNLSLMIAKLEGEILYNDGFKSESGSNNNVITNINNNNTLNTQVSVSIAIMNAQNEISDLTALSEEEINEINDKLDELKEIVESGDKRNTKWQKAKPIFKYIIDKGLEVARIVLPLIQNI